MRTVTFRLETGSEGRPADVAVLVDGLVTGTTHGDGAGGTGADVGFSDHGQGFCPGRVAVVGWRRRAGGGKRDAAERPILEALAGVGAEFWQIGGTGNPDVLVRWKGRLYAGEVKTGNGAETANQGKFPIWRTPDDVLRHIGVIR